jgi:Domain of unknown function (DUF1996)
MVRFRNTKPFLPHVATVAAMALIGVLVLAVPNQTSAAGPHDHTGNGPWPGLVLPNPEVGFATGGTIPETKPIKRTGTGDTGNFRVTCGFSHMNFDDPIIHPNKPGAAHLHTYFGNTQASATSTGASLLNSGNSTCDGGTLNRSSYWIPTVLTTGGQPVVPNYNMIYYKSGYQGNQPSNIAPTLPNGLQLIAGNAKATSSQGEPAWTRQVSWSCSTEGWQGRSASIPACPEGQEILAEIQFPQCWDGKNLSSADHVSHMAYGTWGVGCPATHPVAIPSISFNIHWKVPAGGTTGWHLSSDAANDGRGFSLHADAILAWDPTTSATWLANCVRQIGDCNVGQLTDTSRLMHAPIKW